MGCSCHLRTGTGHDYGCELLRNTTGNYPHRTSKVTVKRFTTVMKDEYDRVVRELRKTVIELNELKVKLKRLGQ